MIALVSHYYCLSPPVLRLVLLSLCLFFCSLRPPDHLAFVSADEFASVILTSLSLWLRMVCMRKFSWPTISTENYQQSQIFQPNHAVSPLSTERLHAVD